MNPRNALRALCGALLLVIMASVGWQVVSARRAEAEAGKSRASRALMLTRLEQLRTAIARLEQGRGAKKAAATAEAALTNVDPPEVLQKRMGILHAWMALRYARLYRKEGFSPEQIQRFESLLEDHCLRNLDVAATARSQGIPFSDPVITQLSKEEAARYNAALNDALGSQLAAQVTEDQRTASVRELADSVAGSTYFTRPLSADQADQLTQILANNSPSYAQGKAAKVDDINVSAALNQAQTILSPEQFAALKNMYDGKQGLKAYNAALAAATQPKPN